MSRGMIRKVLLARPRGFCAGVVRAIDIVRIALETFPPPLYVRKEIVHNAFVVDELRRRGAVFVEELSEIPSGGRVIFSAHGVSPAVRHQARLRRLRIIDATCPLVTKVHLEAARFARKGFSVILIGHPGHDEVIGTLGEAPGRIMVLESIEGVEGLRVDDPQRVAYLTQTTLSIEDTRDIIAALKAKFPGIQGPPSSDICYATQNRQMAVRQLARQVDLFLVVGCENSSNSRRLVEEAACAGIPAYLIGDRSSLRREWLQGAEKVGVTSGASTPESLVEDLLGFFRAEGADIQEHVYGREAVQFSLPEELSSAGRDLAGAREPGD